MAKKYQEWDKKSRVITPSGEVFTAEEWLVKFPIFNVVEHPIIAAGEINGALVDTFSAMQQRYEAMGMTFDRNWSVEETLVAIEAFEDAQIAAQKQAEAEAANIVTAQERTAAALEYQNLLAM